jgi:molybdate transport system permease protein
MNDSSDSWRLPLPQRRQPSLTLSSASGWLIVALACVLILLLLFVPLIALLWQAVPGWMAGTWQSPTVAAALRLSLLTSTLTTFITIIIGTPIAYVLARYQFWGVSLLDILIDLPMVLPPAVAGVALLVTFGRNGVVGQILADAGIQLPFTTAAVVMAQTFVAAPFYIRAAKAGFASVDRHLEQISATLGESALGTFWRVTLPLARNALIGGAIMTWTRSLGEFGATILFAGNFIGRTQTMPLAIYAALQSDLNVALTLAAILLATSFALLVLLRIVTR